MKKTTLLAGAFFAATLILGCQSVPEHISEDLDARQLIQLGQDNYDLHHYAAAKKYFNTVLDRFGDDPKHYIEAKYELGHLFLKQKNYEAAYNNFTEIQGIYQNVPMGLPGSYKILCGIELAKIPEEKLKEFEARARQRENTALKDLEEAARKAELQELERQERERAQMEEAERKAAAAAAETVEKEAEAQEQAAQESEKESESQAQSQEQKPEPAPAAEKTVENE